MQFSTVRKTCALDLLAASLTSTACFVPVIYFFFPETRGLALEEVDMLFTTGSGPAPLAVDKLSNSASPPLEDKKEPSSGETQV